MNLSSPNSLLRAILAALVTLVAAVLILLLLASADTALSVWQRLREIPTGLAVAYAVLLSVIGLAAGWLVWGLLRGRRAKPRSAPAIDRSGVEARLASDAVDELTRSTLRAELAALDQRREQGLLHVALFGEINSGKSSLLRAMVPEADAARGVTGGTTREVHHYRGEIDGIGDVEFADVPGTDEVSGEARADMAKREVLRAHAVVYVSDGDLTRSQAQEVERLIDFGKPVVLVLSKQDRYSPEQRAELLAKYVEGWSRRLDAIIVAQAAFTERVRVIDAEGIEHWREREQPAQVDELTSALVRILRVGTAKLEPAREQAVLRQVSRDVAEADQRTRRERGEAIVDRHARRAVVGALAAVAPGSDIIIQGALATAMVRQLCALYEVPVRDLDLDRFLSRAGGTVRMRSSVVLAIVGNALKAFPGLGTISGGLVHAVAYGMIFDALGRAVVQSLADHSSLVDEDVDSRFQALLAETRLTRVLELTRAIERSPDP